MKLNKQQILQANDRKTLDVPMPEWGGDVTLRELSATQRNDLSRLYQSKKGEGMAEQTQAFSEAILLASVVDETNEPMFVPDDLPALREKSAVALERLAKAALQLNGMTADAATDKEKNS